MGFFAIPLSAKLHQLFIWGPVFLFGAFFVLNFSQLQGLHKGHGSFNLFISALSLGKSNLEDEPASVWKKGHKIISETVWEAKAADLLTLSHNYAETREKWIASTCVQEMFLI